MTLRDSGAVYKCTDYYYYYYYYYFVLTCVDADVGQLLKSRDPKKNAKNIVFVTIAVDEP